MVRVTSEEAQARLPDLLAAAANGETVIIVGGDQIPFQLVPMPSPDTYVGRDGVLYYRTRGEILDEAAGVVYYPNLAERPQEPRQPGHAAGLIHMAEDFDAPLEDFKEYME